MSILGSHKYSIIIPNRFDDIIRPLLDSIKQFESNNLHLVIIADSHDRSYGYDMVCTNDFIFSKSANLGINYVYPSDVILLNDDVRLFQPNTFERLSQIAYSDSSIGILTPMIDGGCGNTFMRLCNKHLLDKIPSHLYYPTGMRGPDRVTFACVYIKRELINQIGLFDEGFKYYGYDDADMCIRTIKAGWKLAITSDVVVRHGVGGDEFVRGKNWNSSYVRNNIGGSKKNLNYLMSKYPDIIRSSKI